jgi:hypothetical protein
MNGIRETPTLRVLALEIDKVFDGEGEEDISTEKVVYEVLKAIVRLNMSIRDRENSTDDYFAEIIMEGLGLAPVGQEWGAGA